MTPRRALALTGLATAALLTAGAFAAPAGASGPPQVDPDSYCYQTAYLDDNPDGQMRFECDYTVYGGTGTVTATYYNTGGLGIARTPYYGPGYDFFWYTGICFSNTPVTITARFTDSTGAQDSKTLSFTCADTR